MQRTWQNIYCFLWPSLDLHPTTGEFERGRNPRLSQAGMEGSSFGHPKMEGFKGDGPSGNVVSHNMFFLHCQGWWNNNLMNFGARVMSNYVVLYK